MDISELTSEFDKDRRRFLGAAVLAAGAAGAGRLGMSAASGAGGRVANAAHDRAPATVSFGPLQQVDAGVLNVGYAAAGPANGQPVILMHGFPYDIHSFVEVAPLLATAGYRVIVPYFRATARRPSGRQAHRATWIRRRSPWTRSR